jgi:hypothetical protein
MNPRRTSGLAAAAVLAVTTLVSSILGLVALKSGGEARLGPATLMEVAAGYDRRATPILAGPAVPPPIRRREAANLSRAAISQFPYDLGAWLRLAYVDYLDHGQLTPAGLSYLKRSYDLIAVDSELGQWRVRFALENSQSLTPELRASVRREVAAMWVNPNHRADLQRALPAIRNPAGRLSLALWLNRLDAAVAK